MRNKCMISKSNVKFIGGAQWHLAHSELKTWLIHCAVPENIHTHPMEGQWKFRGGGGGLKGQNFKRKVGVSKAKILKGKYGT